MIEIQGKEICCRVACPMCRGAEYPEFDPKSINERNFADGMRFKEHSTRKLDDHTIAIYWTTQECWSEYELKGFLQEVKRWGDAWGLEGVTAQIHLEERDGEQSDYREVSW